MMRILFVALLGIGFIGCSKQAPQPQQAHKAVKQASKKQQKQYTRFQTVAPSKAIMMQSGEHRTSCAMCGMDLPTFYKTNYIAEDNNGVHQYCSLHCLVDHLNHGAELKNPKVIDVTTLRPIPVLQAYYVVDSDVKGTMSRVSKYAFGRYEDAVAFQKQHGGKIMDFNAALQAAKQDFAKSK